MESRKNIVRAAYIRLHVDVAMLPDMSVALSSPTANRGHLIAHSCSFAVNWRSHTL